MEGEYRPPETQQQPEIPVIKEGLSAIVLPELGKREYGDIVPATEQETIGKLNAFLEGLNKQGVDIVSVFDQEFDVGRKRGISGTATETRKVAILKKQPRS